MTLHPGAETAREIPFTGRLFIGRECTGIDDSHSLVLDDADVSRGHAEIRLDAGGGAILIDTSTNGTRINGRRIERAAPTPLRSGDRLRIGSTELLFTTAEDAGADDLGGRSDPRRTTIQRTALSEAVLVVGDIVDYTSLAEHSDNAQLASSLTELFGVLTQAVRAHNGTIAYYAGDALFAVWESDHDSSAPVRAIEFALAASDLVSNLAPGFALRTQEGSPLTMGWAVVSGTVAMTTLAGATVTVLGDAVNVAFRIAGLAGRDGRATVLASEDVCERAAGSCAFGAAELVSVRGRDAPEPTRGVARPKPGAPVTSP